MLSYDQLLQLKRWNTPTIYNGWEQITKHNPGKDGFNLEATTDFMPQMGPMVGYAVTLIIEPGNPLHRKENVNAWQAYRKYLASLPGPKIVVVQDLDKPHVMGSFWGEVNSNVDRALGCVGTITDGAIRDLDEMNNAGFKAIAQRLCVGHAFSTPVKWGIEVEVFGRKIKPGSLIHADKHGFLVIPAEDERRLLDAAVFMDSNECNTLIKSARNSWDLPLEEKLQSIEEAAKKFRLATFENFGKKERSSEW